MGLKVRRSVNQKYVTAMDLIRHGSEGPAISQECVSPTDEDQFNVGVMKQSKCESLARGDKVGK